MSFQLEKCRIKKQLSPVSCFKGLLRYPNRLSVVLLDLSLLGSEMEKCGKESVISSSFTGEEVLALEKLSFPKRHREWLGGRLAAKYAAALLYDASKPNISDKNWQTLAVEADNNGRPFLVTEIFATADISISHSGSIAAAMAIEVGHCGIDIQQITPKTINVQERFCTKREMQILQAIIPGPPELQLTMLWAAKEAMRKAANRASLPGFLEMELLEISNDPEICKNETWEFTVNWQYDSRKSSLHCPVAVTRLEDYVLALTARHDTVI
jgi:4'-phosphopantetheinyl transferase EntD